METLSITMSGKIRDRVPESPMEQSALSRHRSASQPPVIHNQVIGVEPVWASLTRTVFLIGCRPSHKIPVRLDGLPRSMEAVQGLSAAGRFCSTVSNASESRAEVGSMWNVRSARSRATLP